MESKAPVQVEAHFPNVSAWSNLPAKMPVFERVCLHPDRFSSVSRFTSASSKMHHHFCTRLELVIATALYNGQHDQMDAALSDRAKYFAEELLSETHPYAEVRSAADTIAKQVRDIQDIQNK
jgi:hypothetical protein